jgi:hypothetical protein
MQLFELTQSETRLKHLTEDTRNGLGAITMDHMLKVAAQNKRAVARALGTENVMVVHSRPSQ